MPRVASPDYVPRKEADIYTFILDSPEENYLAIQTITAALKKSPHWDMCFNRGRQHRGMSKSHGLANSSNDQQGSQCHTCRAVDRWRRVSWQ